MSSDMKFQCNINALKTKSGLLKLFQVILGVTCLILCFNSEVIVTTLFSVHLLMLGGTATVFVSTLLLLSYLVSPVASGVLSKSIFELLHHGISCIFYAGTSFAILIIWAQEYADGYFAEREVLIAVCGILIAVLYLLSAVLSYKSFKAA